MPMPSVKKLHMATCMENLQEKASLDKKMLKMAKTINLCKTAQKMLVEAEKKFKQGDEEMAFVFYFKFVDLVVFLKERTDYSSMDNSKFLSESAPSALDRATNLKTSLSKRYAALKEANEMKETESNKFVPSNEKQDEPETEKVTEEVEDLKISNLVIGTDLERLISASKLFSLIMDPIRSFILLDVRTSRDFEESHVKHSSCVNIPEEILIPGITAKQLESQLSGASLNKWKIKNSVDYVILIDWDSEDIPMSQNHPLRILEDAMCKWDVDDPLKKPPLIVNGGYKEWMLCYPMYTTKALDILSMEAPRQQISVADVSSIVYPDIDAGLSEVSDDASANQNNRVVNGWVSDIDGHSRGSRPLVNREMKPRIQPSTNSDYNSARSSSGASAFGINKEGPSASVGQPVNRTFSLPGDADSPTKRHTPEVNRNLKPAWTHNSGGSKDLEILRDRRGSDDMINSALDNEENILKENLSITQQVLDKENEYAKLRMRKELEAEESKRMELQKQEEMLLETLKSLEKKSRERETKYLELKDENMKIKKLLEAKDDELQKQRKKEMEAIESRNTYMREHVESLRRQRKIEEQKSRDETKVIQSDHGKENLESPARRNHSKDQVKYPTESEYTMPLKTLESNTDGSSRGLTRSYSSPNIAQAVAEIGLETKKKQPIVDRTLKPKLDSSFINVSEISSCRMRNLNPTYGNYLGRPGTGLRNLGNTCYMNSSIQCLSNTSQIANYFASDMYRQHIRRGNKHGTNGEIAEEFAIIIRALWTGHYKSISPKDFKNVVSKHISMCAGSEQQDSHEFLLVLMDKLHGDLNQGYDGGTLPNLDSLADSIASEKFWNHHRAKNKSRISETFEGLVKSTLTCLVCRETSHSYEVFSCLSLPISSSKCALKDCLATFLRPERMSGEAAWDCPGCRQKRQADKSLEFCKLPSVLIIQLKRFSYEGLWRKKIQALVEFPKELEMPSSSSRSTSYSLYGIVNHFGYLEGGHYTAFCKNSGTGKWYKYDDQEVSEISSSDIHTSAAYLLFYSA